MECRNVNNNCIANNIHSTVRSATSAAPLSYGYVANFHLLRIAKQRHFTHSVGVSEYSRQLGCCNCSSALQAERGHAKVRPQEVGYVRMR
jgi:hypothetical protein